jgi:hypothetical protein
VFTGTIGLPGGSIINASGLFIKSGAPWFDIKAFGAILNGANHPLSGFFASLAAAQVVYPHATSLTNEMDWAAIQGAVNAAEAVHGGDILFVNGTAVTNLDIVLSGNNNIRLVGSGWGNIGGPVGFGTVIKNQGTGNGITVGNSGADGVGFIRIRGLTVVGQGGTAHGIQLIRMHNAHVEDNRIFSCGGDGLNLVGSYACHFDRNYSNNNTGWGLRAVGASASIGNDFCQIIGNAFNANTAGGAFLDGAIYGGNGVHFERNDMEGNVGTALRVDVGSVNGWDDMTIRGNYFENTVGLTMQLGTDGGSLTLRAPLIESNEFAPGTGTVAANAVALDRVQFATIKNNKFAVSLTVTANTNISLSEGNFSAGGAVLPGFVSSTGIPAIVSLRVVQDSGTFGHLTMANGAANMNYPFGSSNQLYPGHEDGTQQVSGGFWHSTGVPSNAHGNNNDWCISDNGHQYFKAGGVWVQQAAADSLLAHLAGAEAITGIKTFTANPVFNAAAIPDAALASSFLHLAGAETITGLKTLTASPIVSGAGNWTVDAAGKAIFKGGLESDGALYLVGAPLYVPTAAADMVLDTASGGFDFQVGWSRVAYIDSTGKGTFNGGLAVADAKDFTVGATTGTKIGTATAQKLALHGATPVVQRAGAAQAAVATTASTNTTPYGFTTAAQADALVTLVNELRAAVVEKGLIKGAA